MTMQGKQEFLKTFDEEHARTMRVLRAFPEEKLDFRPHPKAKTARELAWVFVAECALGTKVWNDEFAKGVPEGGPAFPTPPDKWADLLETADTSARDFRGIVAAASDETLAGNVHVFTGPKMMGETSRKDWIWFLLHDQIHHRGQFSVYLRMVDGKVPSIYGPSADEPWR
jgi:uncharacterized damage-inducible protein DinB